MNLSEELKWRGFANQTTLTDDNVLNTGTITFYWGVDPSADSMTIGNLAAAMMIRAFMKHGHNAMLLVGGATGLIGDPDGKAQERDLKTPEIVAHNVAGISAQYDKVFSGMSYKTVNNYDWFKNINYLDFLREVGKNVPMRQMLSRDFVQTRLGEDGAGISYAEFSYSLIQGYDFLHLFREYGVTLQLSGADQWGNCIAGVDLIRRVAGGEAHVYTTPLVINKSTGKKFGKSEDGAVWLDESKTSVYKFYQFWINLDDEGVEDYIKIYTDLDKETIDSLIASHNEDRSKRLAQKRLAYEVTTLVHGEARAASVAKLSEVLFGGGAYSELQSNDFMELKTELPYTQAAVGADLAEVLVSLELASSKGEARRFIQSNAIAVNGEKIPSDKTQLEEADSIHGYCVIRRGKNVNGLIEFV